MAVEIGNPVSNYEVWFAWYPVNTDCGWKWLTHVIRRKYKLYNYLRPEADFYFWKYYV